MASEDVPGELPPDMFCDLLAGRSMPALQASERAVRKQFTAAGVLADAIECFFEDGGPGAGKAYETNAMAEALAPTLECVAAIKDNLGKAKGHPVLAAYRSDGRLGNFRGKIAHRNAWSSAEVAAARNAGDTSFELVTGAETAMQRRLPIRSAIDTNAGGLLSDRVKTLEAQVERLTAFMRQNGFVE